jgi:hypothetical protein
MKQNGKKTICFDLDETTSERLEKIMLLYGRIIKLRLLGEYGIRLAIKEIENGNISQIIESVKNN